MTAVVARLVGAVLAAFFRAVLPMDGQPKKQAGTGYVWGISDDMRPTDRKAKSVPDRKVEWTPSPTETMDGALIMKEIGELYGIRWRWVKKNGRMLVAGTTEGRTVVCALAHNCLVAKRFRDEYDPGPGQDPARVAVERLRIQEDEARPAETVERREEIDGTPHPDGWILRDAGRRHLGDKNGLGWWFLRIDGVRWVVGCKGNREVVNRVVKDEREAIRFMDRHGTGHDSERMRKALVWGEQDIY